MSTPSNPQPPPNANTQIRVQAQRRQQGPASIVFTPDLIYLTDSYDGNPYEIVLTGPNGLISPTLLPGGTSTSFAAITTGTNVDATMTVGTGANLGYTGAGVVNANEIGGINVDGNAPTHAGEVLISQPGNTTAVWADPQVQGLYAAGSSITVPPPYTPPTTIQPILIGGADPSGTLRNIAVTPGGAILTVPESEVVTVNNFAWDTGPTPILLTAGVLVPLISIKPQSGATVLFFFTGMDVCILPAMGQYQILKNGALTGASFANVGGSNMQQDTSATMVFGGTRVDSGFSTLGTRTMVYEISMATTDTITLAVQRQSGAINNYGMGALRWTEQAAL